MTEMSVFANTIYRQKYAMPGENWPDTARRVAHAVMSPYLPELVDEVTQLITDRKFIPGGRYLYAAGKPFHQTQNCLLLKAEDSREGWADLTRRVTSGLMTGAGVGVVYSDLRERGAPVTGMGGESSGPIALMGMVNEIGRHIRQGGSRRSAIWAGLHWWHADVLDFIRAKNWTDDIRVLKERDFNFPAPLDGTNISVILDDDFFVAYRDETHPLHEHAHEVYWHAVTAMLTTAEPGFSIDVGENAGENLRNAPVAADTRVLTDRGYRRVGDILDDPVTVWTGKQWAEGVKFLRTKTDTPILKVTMTGGRTIRCDPSHEFLVERYEGAGERRKLISVDRVAAGALREGDILHVSLPHQFTYGIDHWGYTLGWLYGDGSFTDLPGGGRAELTLCSEDKKACLRHITGYTRIVENDGRGYTRLYWGVRPDFKGLSKETAPDLTDLSAVASFVAGVFDADGNWESSRKRLRLSSKHEGFLRDVARMLESLGILAHVSKAGVSTYGKVQTYQLAVASEYSSRFAETIPMVRLRPELDDYVSYRASTVKVVSLDWDGVEDVYCADVHVEEHSFQAEGVIISNCTEITSFDDNDICNLGSIALPRIGSKEEMAYVVELATAFLLCGTLYSLVPYKEVAETRTKNRRLGLGLMGVYEWLAIHGKPYAPDAELGEWLGTYTTSTEIAARYADRLGISRPVKTRAMAPTGTIGILAECTTSIEPMLASAYKRRYLKGDTWHYQYVVDPTAKRLADNGVDPDSLETAYTLADDPERRVAFQAWVQGYVDHGISSTINLPAFEDQTFTLIDFGKMLMDYLPRLRGITCYPDGSRGGQPLTAVSYAEAIRQEGVEYEEIGNSQACLSGACGI